MTSVTSELWLKLTSAADMDSRRRRSPKEAARNTQHLMSLNNMPNRKSTFDRTTRNSHLSIGVKCTRPVGLSSVQILHKADIQTESR